MKKALVILVVLAMAAPLYADTITFSSPGDNTINYVATGSIAPVAMGLDVDADVDIVVDGVAVDSFFDIFMDAAHDLEETTGYGYGDGTPIADQDAVGELELPLSVFCISMGGLGGETAVTATAPMSGVITLTPSADGTATIEANALRGGVVGTDGVEMTVTGFPLTVVLTAPVTECLTVANSGQVLYDYWTSVGKPECFCYPRQCHGDANGTKTGSAFLGYQYVGTPDLDVLAAAWLVKEPKVGKTWPGIATITGPLGDPGICADFARNRTGSAFLGYQHVSVPDLDAMSPHWLVKEPKVGKTWPGVPADCVPGTVDPSL
jgi:hypothetical protein